ncbi:MAG: hypothetical protein QM601_13385 [Pseudoxanthomonas sp.]
MTDLVIRDLDGLLADRIRRIAAARGWSAAETVTRLIEYGLFAIEAEVRGGFSNGEADALADAIAALREMPEGPAF